MEFQSQDFRYNVCVCMLSRFGHVPLFVILWTVACQAPLSVEFSRQEYWSQLPGPPPGYLPNPEVEHENPEPQVDSLLLSQWRSPQNVQYIKFTIYIHTFYNVHIYSVYIIHLIDYILLFILIYIFIFSSSNIKRAHECSPEYHQGTDSCLALNGLQVLFAK